MRTTSIKEITATAAYAVRHPVLRTGKPIDSCRFEGDDASTTFHLGCFHDDMLVGVVTMMKNSHPELSSKNMYQLRGMAVLREFQKQGIGEALVKKAEEIVRDRNGDAIWMNSREIAVKFYERLGYDIYSKPFNIPKIGLHYVMNRKL